MEELIISSHAAEAMADDGISKDDVGTVVGDYDEKLDGRSDGRIEYSRMMDDGRWLVVVVENDDRTLVTAWRDKRRSQRRDPNRHRRRQSWT